MSTINLEQARLEDQLGYSIDRRELNGAFLKARPALKIEKSHIGGGGARRWNYSKVEDIRGAIHEAICPFGLILRQHLNLIESRRVVDTIVEHQPSGQWVRSRSDIGYFEGADANMTGQGCQSLATYVMKNALIALFCLEVAEECLDSNTQRYENKEPVQAVPHSDIIGKSELEMLHGLFKDCPQLEPIAKEYIKNVPFERLYKGTYKKLLIYLQEQVNGSR